MIREHCSLDDAEITTFFARTKRERERQGMSVMEVAENAHLEYRDLERLESGQGQYVSIVISDTHLTDIASALGYNSFLDLQ